MSCLSIEITCGSSGLLQVAVAIIVSWLIFKNPINVMNAVGCTITLIGCTFYGYVRHRLSQQQAAKVSIDELEKQELLPLVNEENPEQV